MNRLIIFGISLLLGASVFSHAGRANQTPLKKEVHSKAPVQPVVQNDADIVRNLVTNFGKKLQMVSLSAAPDVASKSIRENYANYVSPALLGKWQSDPRKALGRMISSPWPDRIEILTMEKSTASVYKVSGVVVEITSTEKNNGGTAAKRPVTLMVKEINNRWLIDDVTVGPYEISQPVIYKNSQYGFDFSLPDSWKGYTIVTDKWEGVPIGDDQVVETGPLVSIRHPQWTRQNPRQDIPVMIFTLAQWDLLQQEKFHIGAAPIGPSELGRNSEYVFALPARYNFAFPTGYQEVEEILKGKPLLPFDITSGSTSN